jgi:hypothetical protein
MGSFSASRTTVRGASNIEGRPVSAGTKAGPGMVSTLNGLRPVINIVTLNNVVTTTIQIALKGLTSKNDVDDVIGLAAGGAARLIKVTAAETGQIFKISMSCTELPTASSNVGLDIDCTSAANVTRAYDFDLSGGATLIAGGGNWTLGKTKEQLVAVPTANHALYLTTGGTHTGDSVYTAGQLVIVLYGHKLLTA